MNWKCQYERWIISFKQECTSIAPLKRPSIINPLAVSIPSTQIIVSKYLILHKEIRAPCKVAECRPLAKNGQEDSRLYGHLTKHSCREWLRSDLQESWAALLTLKSKNVSMQGTPIAMDWDTANLSKSLSS